MKVLLCLQGMRAVRLAAAAPEADDATNAQIAQAPWAHALSHSLQAASKAPDVPAKFCSVIAEEVSKIIASHPQVRQRDVCSLPPRPDNFIWDMFHCATHLTAKAACARCRQSIFVRFCRMQCNSRACEIWQRCVIGSTISFIVLLRPPCPCCPLPMNPGLQAVTKTLQLLLGTTYPAILANGDARELPAGCAWLNKGPCKKWAQRCHDGEDVLGDLSSAELFTSQEHAEGYSAFAEEALDAQLTATLTADQRKRMMESKYSHTRRGGGGGGGHDDSDEDSSGDEENEEHEGADSGQEPPKRRLLKLPEAMQTRRETILIDWKVCTACKHCAAQ